MWLTSIGITATLLEAVFANNITARVVVAGTSQMYATGDTDISVNELTPMNPQNYYAQTKANSRQIIDMYRGLKPDIGQMAILFNHESPRRAPGFISTDIVDQVVQVIKGQSREVSLRNPYARIDITDARDVVKALARMPLATAKDFVIGSARAVSVFELVENVLHSLNLDGIKISSLNPSHEGKIAPTLIADISNAKKYLSWFPTLAVSDTILEMIQAKLDHI